MLVLDGPVKFVIFVVYGPRARNFFVLRDDQDWSWKNFGGRCHGSQSHFLDIDTHAEDVQRRSMVVFSSMAVLDLSCSLRINLRFIIDYNDIVLALFVWFFDLNFTEFINIRKFYNRVCLF